MITNRHITRIYNQVLHCINEEAHLLYGTDDDEVYIHGESGIHLITNEQELIIKDLFYKEFDMGVKVIGRRLIVTLTIRK